MAWTHHPTLGPIPTWPVDVFLFALSGDDWAKIAMAVVGSSGALGLAFAGAWTKIKAAYDASNAAKLKTAQLEIAKNSVRIDELAADNVALKAENQTLRTKLADRERTIEDRDRAIALRDAAILIRDQAIEEQMRISRRMSGDMADMAEAYLVITGNAKARAR